MGPDDKTTEIELVSRRATDAQRSNIVHVNFSQRSRAATSTWTQKTSASIQRTTKNMGQNVGQLRQRTVDRISPWVIRLVALVAVLLLSLLVL